jgi:transformation/transcription domain-associated protein
MKAINLQFKLLSEIRETLDIVQSADYERFLKVILHIIFKILKDGKPVFQADSSEQKLRALCLEILNRLPHTEALKRYAPKIFEIAMDLLNIENEENALICLRIITDLHKNYRGNFESGVQPFLDFVRNMYANFSTIISEAFSDTSSSSSSESSSNGAFFFLFVLHHSITSFICRFVLIRSNLFEFIDSLLIDCFYLNPFCLFVSQRDALC